MAFVTVYEGIIFIEGEHPRARKVASAQTRVRGFGAQLRNLNELKSQMATAARAYGCNCIVNFSYYQTTKILAIDDVALCGDGFYAQIAESDYKSIISQF